MALSEITFRQSINGIGGTLPSNDFVSGLVIYTDNLPSGFDTDNRIKLVQTLQDAEELGITEDLTDETKATATYQVTNVGSNGNTISISVAEPKGIVNLGTYTKVSGDTTAANVATAIAAVINVGTSTHGYTAVANTDTVTITARAGLGVYLNAATKITATIVGTIAGTLTDFSGGVGSELAVWHYFIERYFKQKPDGLIYLGFFDEVVTHDFNEVELVQIFANSEVRQFGIFTKNAWTDTMVNALQAKLVAMDANYDYQQAVLSADFTGTNIGALVNLSTKNANFVSVCIGQDGNGKGNDLFLAAGYSVPALGDILGTISEAEVSENIAHVARFNQVKDVDLDIIAFATGEKFTNFTLSALVLLENKRYLFLRNFKGYSGSYWNDSYTACPETNDLARIERNRVIQKAKRLIRQVTLPKLNQRLRLKPDGKLFETTIADFERAIATQLDSMVRNGDLAADPTEEASGTPYQILINPAQNVLVTNKVIITVRLIPAGIAKFVEINIGYTPNL